MLLAQQDVRPLIEFTLAPLWEEHGIPLAMMGVFVVFVALVLVVVLVTLLPRVLALIAAEVPTEPERAATPMAVEGDVPEEIVVVIAAAVAETLGTPHRIVKIRGQTPAELGWSLEGRMQHHQSHRFRNRNR